MISGDCTCNSEESVDINACDNCLSTLPICDLHDIVQELSFIECKVAKLACEQIKKSRNNQNRILSELHENMKNDKPDKLIESAGIVKRDETTQSEDDGFEDAYEDVEKGTPRYARRAMQNRSAPVDGTPATATYNVPVVGQTVIQDTSEEYPRRKNNWAYIIGSLVAFVLALAAGYVVRAWLCDPRCRFCIPYPFSEKTYPKPF